MLCLLLLFLIRVPAAAAAEDQRYAHANALGDFLGVGYP
jgi:hypothetical protein